MNKTILALNLIEELEELGREKRYIYYDFEAPDCLKITLDYNKWYGRRSEKIKNFILEKYGEVLYFICILTSPSYVELFFRFKVSITNELADKIKDL